MIRLLNLKYFKNNSDSGFTLIELLVVFSLISLLSTTILSRVKEARDSANYSRAATDIRTMATALELFYQDNGDWPPIGAVGSYCVSPGSGCTSWSNLSAPLKPYLRSLPVPAYPASYFVQNYGYLKGTATTGGGWQVFNSVTGLAVGCVFVYKGYYLDFFWDKDQNKLSLNDGGIDPDGIEFWQGDVRFDYNPANCP